jgi:hypothetical protein
VMKERISCEGRRGLVRRDLCGRSTTGGRLSDDGTDFLRGSAWSSSPGSLREIHYGRSVKRCRNEFLARVGVV